jgi:exodeoxyribonuclease VII small subunit
VTADPGGRPPEGGDVPGTARNARTGRAAAAERGGRAAPPDRATPREERGAPPERTTPPERGARPERTTPPGQATPSRRATSPERATPRERAASPDGDRGSGRGPDGDAQLPYEQAREQLAEVVRRLESGGLTLEESLDLWERGEQLAAICTDWLEGARARLTAVTREQSEPGEPRGQEAPF